MPVRITPDVLLGRFPGQEGLDVLISNPVARSGPITLIPVIFPEDAFFKPSEPLGVRLVRDPFIVTMDPTDVLREFWVKAPF